MESLKKIELRPQQETLLKFFGDNVKNNKKFTLIDAPTGSGKSIFSMFACDWYIKNHDKTATFDILTNSKILQEQYTKEFEFVNSLWGKDSYICEKYNTGCATGEKMCEVMGDSCDNCPYTKARTNFFEGQISLSNFHMFITYKMFVKAFWDRQRRSRVLIIDEANEFEMVLSDFITTQISERALKKLDIDQHVINTIINSVNNCFFIEEFKKIIENQILSILVVKSNEITKQISETDDIEIRKKVLN
jgi:Rad3-related DNA helicase